MGFEQDNRENHCDERIYPKGYVLNLSAFESLKKMSDPMGVKLILF